MARKPQCIKSSYKPGDIVEVYRNLHVDHVAYSVRDVESGLVLCNTPEIHLRDVKMTVQPGGQARSRREQSRNVHAWMRGRVTGKPHPSTAKAHKITYDPYKYNSFVYEDDHTPIWSAHRVELRPDGAYSLE